VPEADPTRCRAQTDDADAEPVSPGRSHGPAPLSAQVARQMSRMPRKDTRPERILRSELHRRGLRFRTHVALPGRPDVIFTRAKLAVFVDGCFWHRCPEHATAPKNNSAWWADKLEANVQRDARQTTQLAALGWAVLRVWEHEDPVAAADLVERTYRQLLGLPERAAT
jgi:DNA mismatch endonuclease (patch repair protein)